MNIDFADENEAFMLRLRILVPVYNRKKTFGGTNLQSKNLVDNFTLYHKI